jgi:uncharacterized protein
VYKDWDENEITRLRDLLDQNHQWPTQYVFKFIVPEAKENELRVIFPVAEILTRSSKNGRYTSVTATLYMESSEEVLTIYRMASRIEGLIAL